MNLLRPAPGTERSVRAGSWNTNIFCRNTGLRRPDDRMKWPSSSAPAARNSSSTSSCVIVHRLQPGSPVHPLDFGHGRAAPRNCDRIAFSCLRSHTLEIDQDLAEILRTRRHRGCRRCCRRCRRSTAAMPASEPGSLIAVICDLGRETVPCGRASMSQRTSSQRSGWSSKSVRAGDWIG